jgi:1-acyl-sn-glycerol-3-phosphate acyltransferase
MMLLLFPFVIIASLFGKVAGGNMIYKICTFWADVMMVLWLMPHENIFEKNIEHNHPVIFVFNHISYMDIPVILKAFRNFPVRILAKAEMSKIPVFGYIYKRATVMVNRENDAARLQSVRELKKVLAKNISIVIAPEGTFNMTHKPLKEFYNGAFKIAADTNTAIQPVLFLDTYDRLNYNSIFSLNPGRSRAVFLPEISPGNDVRELKETVFSEMEIALIKYNASWIKK